MHTQIHVKTYESHPSIFSKINAFIMNSFFGYFNALKFSMFYLPILLEPIINYYLEAFPLAID